MLNLNKNVLLLPLGFALGIIISYSTFENLSFFESFSFYGFFPVNFLSLLCLFPLLGCFLILLIWSQGKGSDLLFKMIAFITSALNLVFISFLVIAFDKQAVGFQFLHSIIDLPIFNLSIVLGLDGLGLVFAVLTAFLIPLCILGFWNSKLFSKEFCISFLLLESLLFLAFFSIEFFFFISFSKVF
jgi:NADH-quinone oxidoreductase subunit M